MKNTTIWADKLDWHILNNAFAALIYDLETWRSGRSEMQDEIKAQYHQLLRDRLKSGGLDLKQDQTKNVLLIVAQRIESQTLTGANIRPKAVADNIYILLTALSDGTFEQGHDQDTLIKHYNFWVNSWFDLARQPREQRNNSTA